MAVLRLANGSDVPVKLGVREVLELLGDGGDAFVEVPGESGMVVLRPSAVIAVIEDARRGSAGFRVSGVAESGR